MCEGWYWGNTDICASDTLSGRKITEDGDKLFGVADVEAVAFSGFLEPVAAPLVVVEETDDTELEAAIDAVFALIVALALFTACVCFSAPFFTFIRCDSLSSSSSNTLCGRFLVFEDETTSWEPAANPSVVGEVEEAVGHRLVNIAGRGIGIVPSMLEIRFHLLEAETGKL